MTSDGSGASMGRQAPPRPRWRAVALIPYVVSTLLSVALAEVGARAFWSARFAVPFAHPDRILYGFYPELQRIDRKRPRPDDGFYDILFLGGSALHRNWGEIEQALQEQLAYAGHRNVRIFNLADRAHTSRDSRLKYAALGGARFDLVMVYDGINDARPNNVPPDLFRNDYGHYSWYEIVNALAPYHGAATVALPYTLRYLRVRIRQTLAPHRYAPSEAPRPEWLRFGSTYRSVEAFRDNIGAILTLAPRRGDRVLLMTYATYLPPNYTAEAFQQKQLDYGLHATPIELWGRPQDVIGAVAAQNAVVRMLATRHAGTLFVDQATLMAGSARYFNDACHLTVLGSEAFVENLMPSLPLLRPR